MTALNPLAVQNALLLRELAKDGPAEPVTAIAKRIGRDESNVRKTIKALIAEGLACEPMTLTHEGQAQLAAIDRAENRTDKPGLSEAAEGSISLVHAQILPDVQNARRDWDSAEAQAELGALKEDIVAHGLLQNLVVRGPEAASDDFAISGPDGVALPLYTLVGGERRWRAIGKAIADGGWPADRRIACRVLDTDNLGHRLAALSENLQRRNLNPLEKAKAFDGLAQAFADNGVADDKINREIADRVGVTIEHVQQTRSLLKLDEADQARLALPKDDPKRLTVSDARKKVSVKAEKEAAWKPTDQSPEEQLVIAELAFIARKTSSYLGSSFMVGPESRTDPVAVRLAELNIIDLPEELAQWGDDTGQHKASFRGWTLTDAIRSVWPAVLHDDAEKRSEGLLALQIELTGAGPTGGRTFLTDWLNGPFGLTEAGKAIVAERQAADEKRLREDQARADARAATLTRWGEARTRHLAILNAAAEKAEAGSPEDNQAIAADLDRPLPWSLTAEAIVAANGETVRRIGNHYTPTEHELALAQMMVVAVNAAGGQVTPPPPVEEEEDDAPLEETVFVQEITDSLQDQTDLSDDGARAQAEEILHEFLTDNSVVFGDLGFDWTAGGAQTLTDEWVAESSEAGTFEGEADASADTKEAA
ncbi:hypothetical protein [Brevundimonas sp. DC300-4]|uniref:ParB/RepB/Spo0J family partition protein n=1 Tax=Brevundimonas sp. DC300-4 TaxID=2804594 RepID=UPI003CEF9D67